MSKRILLQMSEFWRTWYILFRLRRKILRSVVTDEALAHFLGTGGHYFTPKDFFLNEISEKFLFLIPRSTASRTNRILKDTQILEKLIPAKIEERTSAALKVSGPTVPDTFMWIRTTGAGDSSVYITNALEEFLTIYKGLSRIVSAALWAVPGYIWWLIFTN